MLNNVRCAKTILQVVRLKVFPHFKELQGKCLKITAYREAICIQQQKGFAVTKRSSVLGWLYIEWLLPDLKQDHNTQISKIQEQISNSVPLSVEKQTKQKPQKDQESDLT